MDNEVSMNGNLNRTDTYENYTECLVNMELNISRRKNLTSQISNWRMGCLRMII